MCLILCNLGTVACQAPLSMGFSRQEYWNVLPCPPPGDIGHHRYKCLIGKMIFSVSYLISIVARGSWPPHHTVKLWNFGDLTVCFGHPQDSAFTQRSCSLVQEHKSASLILLSACPPLSLHSWHRRIDSCCPQHCCVHVTEETACPPTRPHPSVGRETGRKLLSERSSQRCPSVTSATAPPSFSRDVPAARFLGTVVSSAS